MNHLRLAYDRAFDPSQRVEKVEQPETALSPPAEPSPTNQVKPSVITPRYFALAPPFRAAMNTVQANVRIPPEDKPLVVAVAARLRSDSRFRERLRRFLEEDASSPDLAERVERLEQQVGQLLNALNETRSTAQTQNPSRK